MFDDSPRAVLLEGWVEVFSRAKIRTARSKIEERKNQRGEQDEHDSIETPLKRQVTATCSFILKSIGVQRNSESNLTVRAATQQDAC